MTRDLDEHAPSAEFGPRHQRPEAGATGVAPVDVTRVVVRPLASPLPLGFLALAAGSLLLSAPQLGWVPVTEGHRVALALLAFTVPLQFLACLAAFGGRDGVFATGMGVLSGAWAATAIVLLGAAPDDTSGALGVLLVVAAGALLVPTAAAATTKLMPALVLASAAARFAVNGAYELTGSASWQHTSGITGIVVAGLALYGALALELESVRGRSVLPVLRHHRGRRALSGDIVEQFAGLAREAGVREEL